MNRPLSYAWSRRRFLQGIGAAAGLATVLKGLERAAEGGASPKRLLIVQRPVGTIHNAWWPVGTGTDFTLSRILTPLESMKNRMVVLRDLELPSHTSSGGGHELGTVLMLTGMATTEMHPGNGGDDPIAKGPSIDQVLARQSAEFQGTAFSSLQVSCDSRADTEEISTRHMSYEFTAPFRPMDPYYKPLETYQRVFASLMPGGANGDNLAALERARRQKKSVLDFALSDLKRMESLAPSSQRETLEGHAAAIREVEKELDHAPVDPVSCGIDQAPEVINVGVGTTELDVETADSRDDEKHAKIGDLHFKVIKAAFRCDLTRVATFQWSPGTNHVSFGGLWPSDRSLFKIHHAVSHLDANDPQVIEFLTQVEEFYARQLLSFLKQLDETPDAAGGTLLDNTLVPYVTEVAKATHEWKYMPWLLFGGANTKLRGGQVWDNSGSLRSTNDMWMACAGALGLPEYLMGNSDQRTTPISGLFG